MKRKIIFALSLAALLGVGALTSLSGCSSTDISSGGGLENRHKVTVKEISGVSVNGISEDGYAAGDTVTFTISVTDSTKIVNEVHAKDVKLTPKSDGSYAFEIGNEDVEISITLNDKVAAVETAILRIKDGISHGSVTLSRLGEVKIGESVTIIATPDSGYEVDKYYLDDSELSSNTFVVSKKEHVVNVTFKEQIPETVYGSVVVDTSKVTNGNVVAKLEDGTEISEENRRQPVGTTILLDLTPQDECYEIKEIKLNDEVLTPSDGKYSFTVKEGKNFISASFGLIHPGQGLVKFVQEVEYADVTIDKVNGYYEVGEVVTIRVTPKANYSVKEVTVNKTLVSETDVENVFTFEVQEGLNLIEINVTSTAEGVKFVIPEDWLIADDLYNDAYYIVKGESYQLETTFTPEGSFDDLVFEVSDYDKPYIEVSETGLLTAKETYNSNVSVKVSLKSNPSVSDTLWLRVVSSTHLGVETLKDELDTAIDYEKEEANKTKLVVEETNSDGTSSKTTYDFETFNDNHSITTVTDEKGITSHYYRTILDNTFYSLFRDASGTSVPYNGDTTAITGENREEYETKLNTFGAIEFDYSGSYSGVIDYFYQNVFGESSIYDPSNSYGEYNVFKNTTIINSLTETDLVTKIRAEGITGPYAFDVHMYFEFDFFGKVQNAVFERKDYDGIESVDQEITDSTPYDLLKYTIDLTYDEKGSDENNYFNMNDYFFKDFTPEVYLSRDLNDESKVIPEGGIYNVDVSDTVYIALNNVLPESALQDIDEVTLTSDNEEIEQRASSSNGIFYFDVYTDGEFTINLKSKNVTKELKFKASFKKIESITFDDSVPESVMAGDSIKLDSTLTPDEGISTDEVEYTIISDSTGGAKLEEREVSYGYGIDQYLIAGPSAGEIKIRVTALGDETVFDEKTISVTEAPNVLVNLVGKTYVASYEEGYWPTTYYEYKIVFGDDSENLTAEIEYSVKEEYGDTTSGKFSAKVAQNGVNVVLTELTPIGESGIDASEVPSSLKIVYTSENTFDKLVISTSEGKYDLSEFVDITPIISGNTYTVEWSGYSDSGSAEITFEESDGKLTATIIYKVSDWYSGESEATFTADVSIGVSTINFSNFVRISGDTSTGEPPSSMDYTLKDGVVTITYEGSGYYY